MPCILEAVEVEPGRGCACDIGEAVRWGTEDMLSRFGGSSSLFKSDMTLDRLGSDGVDAAGAARAGGIADMGAGRGSSLLVGEKPKVERLPSDELKGVGVVPPNVEKPIEGLWKTELIKPGRGGEAARSSFAGFRSSWCSG